MISKEVMIQNKLGLHARTASKFVSIAKEYACKISVTSPYATADGKSIMKVMLLQGSKGTTITLETDGADEVAASEALLSLINAKFDETQ